jgi:spermidine/putrescine transport system permease protein
MGSSRWTWRLLALPGVAWLSVFFLVALYAVLAVAFGNQDTLSQPVPFWNPLDWNVGYVLEMLKNIWHGDQFLTVSLRTIEFVVIAVGLSLLIGYPVAYFTARHAGRWRGLVLLALILPLWINYLMRMLAWINLLAPDGLGTRLLHTFGIEKLFLTLGLLAEPGSRRPSSSRSSTATCRSSSCRSSSPSTGSTGARSRPPATSAQAR